MVAEHMTRMQTEQLRLGRARDASAKHKRGAVRLLRCWASWRRLSDLSTSFLSWKHSAQMLTVTMVHNRNKETRARKIASRTFRCVAFRQWKRALERAWAKWRAFSAQGTSIQRLRSLCQNKIILLKRKWVEISNGKMHRNMQKLKRKMTRQGKRNVKFQSLLLRLRCSKVNMFRIQIMQRYFRRWRGQSQLDTLQLQSDSLERSEAVLSVMVSRLREGLCCQQALTAWRGFALAEKLRKRDVLHTRLLLQMEDEKSVLRAQLAGMGSKLDDMQYTLIDRQAEYASNSRDADIRRAVSILGSLFLCRNRCV